MSRILLGVLLASAASVYAGDELAQAQKRGDLVEIQKIVRKTRANNAGALHELMMTLDAGRSRAFVSAHVIARNLLLDATRSGEKKFVGDAAQVIAKHVKGKGVGKCAKAMKYYADGMTDTDADKALFALSKAHKVFCDEGWVVLAIHTGVEIAARSQDAAAGAAAIEKLFPLYPRDADYNLRQVFRALVEARLAGASKEVRAACDKVLATEKPGGSVSAAGGKGGKGGSGGGLSKVGNAIGRYPKKKSLVTAKRTRGGFDIREGFDKRYRHTQALKHGLAFHDDGGVTLGFWGYAVGLGMLDPSGLNGQPGGSSAGPRRHLAYYFLARGETWGFNKTGVVSIK